MADRMRAAVGTPQSVAVTGGGAAQTIALGATVNVVEIWLTDGTGRTHFRYDDTTAATTTDPGIQASEGHFIIRMNKAVSNLRIYGNGTAGFINVVPLA